MRVFSETGLDEDRGAKAPETKTCRNIRENSFSIIHFKSPFYSTFIWIHFVKI